MDRRKINDIREGRMIRKRTHPDPVIAPVKKSVKTVVQLNERTVHNKQEEKNPRQKLCVHLATPAKVERIALNVQQGWKARNKDLSFNSQWSKEKTSEVDSRLA